MAPDAAEESRSCTGAAPQVLHFTTSWSASFLIMARVRAFVVFSGNMQMPDLLANAYGELLQVNIPPSPKLKGKEIGPHPSFTETVESTQVMCSPALNVVESGKLVA